MEKLKWTFIKEDTNCNYEVCSNGVIISKVNFPPTPVKTYEEEGGLKVRLHNIGGKHIKKYVHYVVAECFLPNPDNLPYVNHKDGNKWNNNVENLEWSAVNELKKGDEREEVTYTTPAPLYVPQEEDLKPKRGRKKKYGFKTREEYFKWWLSNNREKINEYQREYRKTHKNQCAQYCRKWREKNRERNLEYQREYQNKYRKEHYAEMADKQRERALNYYYEHKDEIALKRKMKRQEQKIEKPRSLRNPEEVRMKDRERALKYYYDHKDEIAQKRKMKRDEEKVKKNKVIS